MFSTGTEQEDLLRQSYLLATSVIFFKDAEGRIWIDELWWHDLRRHLDYLQNMVVLAPVQYISVPAPNMAEAIAPPERQLKFVAIHPAGGMKTVLKHLPAALRTAWKAVGTADIVHSGVAGWPIPVGAFINPIAVLRHKNLIIVVESAFWRKIPGKQQSQKERLRAILNEYLAKWSVRHAKLAIFTHDGYRRSLPVGPHGVAIVKPASWITGKDIISTEQANAAWSKKQKVPKFLLASRLVPEKGIPLFLDAIGYLEKKGISAQIDVIGSGPMQSEINIIAQSAKFVTVRILDPVPYGAPFLTLLREYHALLLPLVGDEQARILYDSFSQAVPIIATDTDGNRSIVTAGETGWIFPKTDPEAFARAIEEAIANPETLHKMGFAAMHAVSGYTHEQMHRDRAEVLRDMFGTKPTLVLTQ